MFVRSLRMKKKEERGERERQTDIENQRQTDRQTDRDKQTDRQRERERELELILKDSSVRSIWTYVTASPCYTTHTNKHDYTTNKYYKYELAVDKGSLT